MRRAEHTERYCAAVLGARGRAPLRGARRSVGFHYFSAPRLKGDGRSDVIQHFAMNKMAPNRPSCWVEVERGLVIMKHTSSD